MNSNNILYYHHHYYYNNNIIETAGYSPKTLVLVITLVIAGVAVAISLGFTSYHNGIYHFVRHVIM